MLVRRLEVKKQAFRQLGEEDGHEKNEGKEGEGQASAPRRLSLGSENYRQVRSVEVLVRAI